MQVIRQTLDSLPPDADLAVKKRALRDAYPFASRKYLPYKHWCRAVREALAVRRGKAGLAVRVLLGPDKFAVVCDWCQSRGCVACVAMRDEAANFYDASNPEGLALLDAVCDDPDARPVLADWLEERGYVELPKRLRKEG